MVAHLQKQSFKVVLQNTFILHQFFLSHNFNNMGWVHEFYEKDEQEEGILTEIQLCSIT